MSRGHRARKRFGQHFLHDGGAIEEIVAAVLADQPDTVVEIGPGQGAITTPIADSGVTLHAVEFDRDLVTTLRQRFASNNNVVVHEADALAFDYSTVDERFTVVGNLPYNISTPLLFHLLNYSQHISAMVLMLQKEVVQRITAEPGTKNFGRLTIMLGCRMQSMTLFDVPPEAFSPPPKVWSSVVALRPLPAGTYPPVDHDKLAAVVAKAFSQRRKTLHNALKGVISRDALERAEVDPMLRPEQISIGDWIALANDFANHT